MTARIPLSSPGITQAEIDAVTAAQCTPQSHSSTASPQASSGKRNSVPALHRKVETDIHPWVVAHSSSRCKDLLSIRCETAHFFP
jgi:hypothetical protein